MIPRYPIDIVTRDGRKVPLEVSSRLIMKNGKPAGIQGIARDFTERKLFEQMLACREKRLDSFFLPRRPGLPSWTINCDSSGSTKLWRNSWNWTPVSVSESQFVKQLPN